MTSMQGDAEEIMRGLNTPHGTSKIKKLFKKPKKKPNYERPQLHEYFKDHQCSLPPESINPYVIKCGRFKNCILNLAGVNMRDLRAKNLYRSYSALCAEKFRQYNNFPCSIHPFSKLRIWIEAFVAISIFISNVALALHFSERDPQKVQHYMAMYTFDVIYIVNILTNLFTGYVEGSTCQYVILETPLIAWKYIRTWFIVDLVSLLGLIPGLIYLEDVFIYLLLVSMKILRLPTMLRYLDNMLIVLRVGDFHKTLINISAMVLSYLFWNMYFQLALEYMKMDSFYPTKPNNCSWITLANIWNATTTLRFVYTMDRAVGMLRKNSHINLIEQKGCYENFFIAAWLVAKMIMSHSVLKYIVSLFGKESPKAKYFIMTQQVKILMNQRRFPPRIKEKILKFYAIRFQSHFFAESKMLNCVTGQLREDIIMHTGRQLVRELEFLKQLPRALLLQIGLKLKIVIFIAGDIIFKINTVGDCLYFIDKGSVAIYSESGNEICHLEDGDYFGEIALVMNRRLRTASAVAVTNCELFRLDKEDFDSSIAYYPTVYESIKKVAINRYERTCVLDEHHKAELKMAEDHALKGHTDDSNNIWEAEDYSQLP